MSVSKRLFGSLFSSVSVANSGATPGVDYTLTLTERGTGTTFALVVTSATTIGQWNATTPSGYFIRLTDRVPATTTTALTYITVQANDEPSFDENAGAAAVGLNRIGGAYVWQGAPVVLPSIESGLVAATSQVTGIVTTNYAGGTTAPATNQRFFGVTFAAGSTPPGCTVWCQSFADQGGSGSIGFGFYGRNTAGGSTAVALAVMSGSSGNTSVQIGGMVGITTNTQRAYFLDHTNSGGTGAAGGIDTVSVPALNTDNEWTLYLVRTSGSGTGFRGSSVRVWVQQEVTTPSVSFA